MVMNLVMKFNLIHDSYNLRFTPITYHYFCVCQWGIPRRVHEPTALNQQMILYRTMIY